MILLFSLINLSLAQTLSNEEVQKELNKKNRINKLIGLVTAHPKRAGTRDKDKIIFPKKINENEKFPVIILLHGIYVSADTQDHFFEFKDRIEKDRFILYMPGSTYDQNGMRFWNATDSCCDHFNSNVDDTNYLRQQIKELIKDPRVDSTRIIVVGHSNGAFMAQKLACDASDLISGVVSFSGEGYLDKNKCKPQMPIHLIQINDKKDNRIKYDGLSQTELHYRTQNNKMYPLKNLPLDDHPNLENCNSNMNSNLTDFIPNELKLISKLDNKGTGSPFPSATINFENWKKINQSKPLTEKPNFILDFEKKLNHFEKSEYQINPNSTLMGFITTNGNGHMPKLSKAAKVSLIQLILSLNKI